MSAKTKPADNAIVLVPSDSVGIFDNIDGASTRAIFVGVGGDISVEMLGNDGRSKTVVFTAVATAQVLPIAVTRVNSTNTTATDIVGLW